MINVQFSDDSNTRVVSYFGSRQDPDFYENIGEIEASNLRWLAYYESINKWDRTALPVPVYK